MTRACTRILCLASSLVATGLIVIDSPALAQAPRPESPATAPLAIDSASLPSARYFDDSATTVAPLEKQPDPDPPPPPPPGGFAQPDWDGEKIVREPGPQFPPPTFAQEMLDGFRPAASAAFGLADLTVQEIRMVERHGETFIAVQLPDEQGALAERIVRVHPYSSRAPDAKVLVQVAGGALIEHPWPEVSTYRGHVEGAFDMDVAASIRGEEVSMMLLPGDPQRDIWFVQPLRDGLPGMPGGLHVVYRAADVIPTGAQCGWSEMGFAPEMIPAAVQPAGGDVNAPRPPLAQRVAEHMPPNPAAPPHRKHGHEHDDDDDDGGLAGDDEDGDGTLAVANIRVQIGYDADFEFYQANGSSVLNTIYDMMLIMNQVGLIYQNQVAIAYTDVLIIVRTAEPDPYTSTNANTLLCQFGEWWNNNVSVTRDVAHLFTGKDLDGTTVGLAWIGAICAGNFNNCNASGSALNYGLVQSRFSTTMASRVQDSAHELGHNWNACHCNTGGNCGGGTSNPACGIMTSNISGQLTFDSAAVTAITGYRDGRPCLDVWQNPTYVNWSWGGIENGSFANPWNTIFEGLDACLVGGALNVQAGNYFQNPNIFKAKTINALNGTVRIGSN